jgi:chitinase
MRICLLLLLFCFRPAGPVAAQTGQPFHVIAYYAGGVAQLDSFPVEKLTHIIYCFGHLQGNRFHLAGRQDTLMVQRMVALKRRNPRLKVLLSLGGWGGCAPCSDVFSTVKGRREFARSVMEINDYLGSDGIDLDWEYPAIEGYPGHAYRPEDRENFTRLVKLLRRTLGKKHTLSFAAGGFQKFLEESVEWKKVMRTVDFVNLMTYDLVNGYATVTGHHTPLYSTPQQKESTDNAVQHLLKLGIPARQLVIGAAFYTRMWENVAPQNNGLYQSGVFRSSTAFRDVERTLSPQQGFVYHWDDTAQAPYLYNAAQKLFVTYDDPRSIALKTKYALDHRLGGIMFWELSHDRYGEGLLEVIDGLRKK